MELKRQRKYDKMTGRVLILYKSYFTPWGHRIIPKEEGRYLDPYE